MARAGIIVYACPLGPLAAQLDRYFAAARDACGPNTAHEYMPHVTLTGFFQDAPEALPSYAAALEAARERAAATRPEEPLEVTGMALNVEFHGLLLEGAWLKRLVADFAASAGSPPRREAIRLKEWLHLSLAYGFPPEQHGRLAELARALVDPRSPAAWELRLYQSHGDGRWTCHAAWPL
jgi:hypothetical protein